VPVNVSAISPSLLESELFGHVRGSFTGADRDRPGLLREAHGGVLFLDEITEMEPDLQARLLRFLEDNRVRPVGADRTEAVDLRIVAATNRDPHDAIQTGRFRRDLYYRLAVVTVEVPPLRERRSDIPELVQRFFAAAAANRATPPVQATKALLHEMVRRSWPGNLRQLRNEVLRLDALAEGAVVDVAHLSPDVAARSAIATELDLHRLEQWAVQQALLATAGNKAEAARLLGISRRALYNKLERGAAE
jgi:DNA-binding NtrC family response regulator